MLKRDSPWNRARSSDSSNLGRVLTFFAAGRQNHRKEQETWTGGRQDSYRRIGLKSYFNKLPINKLPS